MTAKYRYHVLLALPILLAAAPATHHGTVASITDGDTLKVRTPTATLTVRLEGIDAPEKAQPFGNAAKKHLTKLAHGKAAVIVSRGKDKHGRTLADVLVDGKSVNLAMVEAGLAWHYKTQSKDKRLAAAEVRSRKKKLGLWSDQNAVAPWVWRKMTKAERAKAQSGRTEPLPAATSELTHWLNTNGGVRHNSGCRWFGATKRGRRCTADEGRACGICGG